MTSANNETTDTAKTLSFWMEDTPESNLQTLSLRGLKLDILGVWASLTRRKTEAD